MFELLSQPEVWISFLTLTFLEIVLGIDNIIFLSILVSRLPKDVQPKGRVLGLAFAMVTRIGLLFSLTWLIGLTAPWFTVLGEEISGRDLILFAGGLFLLAKSVSEIHNALEGIEHAHREVKLRTNVLSVAIQIGIIDIVFLARLGPDRGRARQPPAGHGRRDRARGDRDDVPGAADPRVHRAPPDDQDAGAVVPDPDRRRADRRVARVPRPEGLPVLRDGVLGGRRDDQHPAAQEVDAAWTCADRNSAPKSAANASPDRITERSRWPIILALAGRGPSLARPELYALRSGTRPAQRAREPPVASRAGVAPAGPRASECPFFRASGAGPAGEVRGAAIPRGAGYLFSLLWRRL